MHAVSAVLLSKEQVNDLLSVSKEVESSVSGVFWIGSPL